MGTTKVDISSMPRKYGVRKPFVTRSFRFLVLVYMIQLTFKQNIADLLYLTLLQSMVTCLKTSCTA
jgi:hypothetical protein